MRDHLKLLIRAYIANVQLLGVIEHSERFGVEPTKVVDLERVLALFEQDKLELVLEIGRDAH